MEKKEFLKKLFGIAQEINDTDDKFEILLLIDDAERLYDEHVKELKEKTMREYC